MAPIANADDEVFVSLKDALSQLSGEASPSLSSYKRLRRQAHSGGGIFIGGKYVAARKVRGRWMINEMQLQRALVMQRAAIAYMKKRTADYNACILHPNNPEGSNATEWGGYVVHREFHYRWITYQRMTQTSDGCWICNTCWRPASTENNNPECHICADWGHCGRDCTLSRIFCKECGTSASPKTM
jgi:hypothetical protein